MLIRSVNRRFLLPKWKENARSYCVPVVVENAQEQIEYPSILDIKSPATRRRKYAKENVEAVKNCETVEEKIFKLNMPRYWGWKPVLLRENEIEYNSLPSAQYITRTHIMPEKKLPASYYDEIISSDELNLLAQQMKNKFEEALLFEYQDRLRDKEIHPKDTINQEKLENMVANSILKQINRFLITSLSPQYSHLMEAEVDFEPRIEAFWKIGGIPKNAILHKKFANSPWGKDYADEPIDRWMQYFGHPVVQLRHNLPLKEVMSLEESKNPDFNIPDYKYCPSFLGYHRGERRGTITPGFWPGDPMELGLLSLHNRGHFLKRSPHWDDAPDALFVQAILASYSWLYTQACYQGFSTYNDVTYPLVHQSVITNGKLWSFFVYQLNTTKMHHYAIDENNKKNICWGTESMQLFESIENGKMQGFNDDVLKHLIKFYVNAPRERNIEMKPYLGKAKVIAEIEDPERRDWLETHFKHLMANRPRGRVRPRILLWQKIYMIDHKTRPIEKKREPWEFGIDPNLRRMDDHEHIYIPKDCRPKKKTNYKSDKWAKTFYP